MFVVILKGNFYLEEHLFQCSARSCESGIGVTRGAYRAWYSQILMEPQVTQLGVLRWNLVNPQMSMLATGNCF